MFKLRDGSKVRDKRLARIYQYDPRNKKFLIKRLIAATEPRSQINMKEEYFTLHNSWGDGWADMGAAKISFKTMRRLLAEEGEAVFFVNRKSKL